MIKAGYARDNAILRAHYIEKKRVKRLEDKKTVKSINEKSLKRLNLIRRSQKAEKKETSQSGNLKTLDEYLFNETNQPIESLKKDKIIAPIEVNSEEYEAEIREFLGTEVKKPIKLRKLDKLNRSKSGFIRRNKGIDNNKWNSELRIIDEKEKTIKRSLKALDLKQKSGLLKKSRENLHEKSSGNLEIIQSLKEVTTMLKKIINRGAKKNN